MRIFDAHLHIDTRGAGDIRTLALYGVEAVVTCAHDALSFSVAESLLDHFERLLGFDSKRLRENCITPYVALGIHPRGIPKRGLKRVIDSLPEMLAAEHVVAVGEIGLESGSDEEMAVLRSQMEIADRLGLPCIVHTPARNKVSITEKTLEMAAQLGMGASRILIDHVDEGAFDVVKDAGCWIGLTVQSGKLSAERAADIIIKAEDVVDRIVLDSDLASGSLDLLPLPSVVLELRRRGVPRGQIEKVAFANACKLFHITLADH